jgi:hypothetical protein
MVTDAPTAPEVGDRLVMLGVAALPLTGVQTNAIKTEITDSRKVMRGKRFIRSSFCARISFLRLNVAG